MFLPATTAELKKLGWSNPDIIIVTGDTYIDSPFIGAAVIGKYLLNAGYRVGIIAQPDINSGDDIARLGEPSLFWGVTAGSLDSMVANYTASKKRRKNDDFTPGGLNIKRPDRAVIAYSNLIRRYFKNTKPIVLGGIEASLRRIAHYDYWDDTIRKSILFDAKADILVYGMGEKTVSELAGRLKSRADITDIRGICYIGKKPAEGYESLPSFEEVKKDKGIFVKMFNSFYANNAPSASKGLCQQQDTRFLIHNPPAFPLTGEEIDEIYDMDFEREVHPYYEKMGDVRAQDTIKFSITTHRGCFGECNFCSISVHQGEDVVSRSKKSIIREAERISRLPDFKGYILDVGGPTANMYGIECSKKKKSGSCKDKRCMYPNICASLNVCHNEQIELLKALKSVKGVKKVFVASGIRHDMVMEDEKYGLSYLEEIVRHHTSGQLKIAPEHTEDDILRIMGKTGEKHLKEFKDRFYETNRKAGKKQFLTYYIIAAHPGCSEKEMQKLKEFTSTELRITPEQVQIFTPTPSTYSTLMYYTGINPFTNKNIFVERDIKKKERQKEIVVGRKER